MADQRVRMVTMMNGKLKTCELKYLAVSLFCALFAAALTLDAAQTDVTSDSWQQTDKDGYIYFSEVPDGLQVRFIQIGMPTYCAATLVAGSSSSPDVFMGDYITSGVKSVKYRIRSDLACTKPAGVMLTLRARTSGRIWRNTNVNISTIVGQWVTNAVNFTMEGGWTRDGTGDKAAMWAEDIRDVEYIGIRIDQNGKEAKTYVVGDFALLDIDGSVIGEADLVPEYVLNYFKGLYGVSDSSQITDEMKNTDSDEDGMSDWLELLAGTNPQDANSVFAAELEDDPDVEGVTVSWPCITSGVYTLMRTENLMDGFAPLISGLIPTPEQAQAGVMSYTDSSATGNGPYFYKVFKE